MSQKTYLLNLDAKNAIEHRAFMDQTVEALCDKCTLHLCKLPTTVHGLKKSPCQWQNTILPVLDQWDLILPLATLDDFVRCFIVDGEMVLLEIYVDDVLILNNV